MLKARAILRKFLNITRTVKMNPFKVTFMLFSSAFHVFSLVNSEMICKALSHLKSRKATCIDDRQNASTNNDLLLYCFALQSLNLKLIIYLPALI